MKAIDLSFQYYTEAVIQNCVDNIFEHFLWASKCSHKKKPSYSVRKSVENKMNRALGHLCAHIG